MKGPPTPPPGALQSVLHWKFLPYAIGLVLLVLVVALVVWLVIRHRRKRAAKAEAPPRVRVDLGRIWRAFLRGMPPEHRRTVALYQPIVVLGGAGSGKSTLIDRCTDWRGQTAHFRPSYTDDPLLQVFHGPDAVVQEVSPVVLADTSGHVRHALLKLWRRLRRGKEPKVVVVLDAVALVTDPPDVMVKLAQLVRGKINVLSRATKRPVSTSLVLTHMDRIGGYLELSRFMHTNRAPLTVPIGAPEEIEHCLEPLEEHLPRALATRQPGGYLRIVSFFERVPDLLARLASFVRALQNPDPTSLPPQLNTLSLTSSKDPEGSPTNPLAACVTHEDVSRFRPLRRHQLAAAIIAAVGAAYLAAGFIHEHAAISEAKGLLAYLTDLDGPSLERRAALRQRFFDHINAANHSVLTYLLPAYHTGHRSLYKREIYFQFIGSIRSKLLYPRLVRYVHKPDVTKTVYCLGLIHATSDNHLGKMISGQQMQWEDTLGLPGDLVDDYLRYRDPKEKLSLPVDPRRLGQLFALTEDADYASAVFFFQELTKAVQEPYISQTRLEALRSRAETLLKDVKNIDHYRNLARILDNLQKDTGLSIALAWRRRVADLPKIDTRSLNKLLEVLKSQSIRTPDVKQWQLSDVLTEAERIAAGRATAGATLEFAIAGKQFRFSAADWHALINRSRIIGLLQEYAAKRAAEPIEAFFASKTSYTGPSMRNDPIVGGNGRVNGVYTRDAFDEQVKPVLAKMPKSLEQLPIDKKEKEAFAEFVVALVGEYAEGYVDEYRRYFAAFKYRRKTRAALRYILAQFQLPSSPLKTMLADIEENTSLELDEENKFIEPMAQVSNTFAFLQTMMAKPKGGAAAVDGYGTLLGQLQKEIDSTAPFTPANENDPTNALRGKLSALGRASLSIFLESDDSYVKLVEGWLGTSNVPPEWQQPFLEPILIAYALGLQNVNGTIADVWSESHRNHLVPLRSTFPFAPQADEDAGLSLVQEALHPEKGFWTTFNTYLAPVCTKKQGQWSRRGSRLQPVRLPDKMLDLVNAMAHLGQQLWDDKGAPKALPVAIKPLPLPGQKINDFAVVLAYLQVGESAVFSFNQTPYWHELKLKWWTASTAAIGAAFARTGESKKVYRNTTVGDSMWSFYRLLRRARTRRKASMAWQWVISGPGPKQAQITVDFQTRNDPWELFQALAKKIGAG